MGRKTRRLHALVAVGKHEEVVSPRSFLVLSVLHDDEDDEEEDEELAPTREDSDDVSAAAADDDDDDSVSAIYASHVLEHCHYVGFVQHVQRTLREWHRVLALGGGLLLAVPVLSALSRLFVNESLSDAERFFVMCVMYGGQVDAFDVHRVGFNDMILASFLENEGFCEIQRVSDFGVFHDSSTLALHGMHISPNVVARACKHEHPRDQWIHVLGCSTDSKFLHLAWINTPRKKGGLGEMQKPLVADYNKESA
ncbi:hypothetical protein ATCC90586_006096 [Pythium insidiosum]|nr:hypothetical protein ATCC90586_006096 [Pythium insidiosum]